MNFESVQCDCKVLDIQHDPGKRENDSRKEKSHATKIDSISFSTLTVHVDS